MLAQQAVSLLGYQPPPSPPASEPLFILFPLEESSGYFPSFTMSSVFRLTFHGSLPWPLGLDSMLAFYQNCPLKLCPVSEETSTFSHHGMCAWVLWGSCSNSSSDSAGLGQSLGLFLTSSWVLELSTVSPMYSGEQWL